MTTDDFVRSWPPQAFGLWVAEQLELALRSSPAQGDKTIKMVRDVAMQYGSLPPKTLLGMVQFQHEYNGKTWPRAWALSLWLKGAHLYYRRKR